MKMLETPVMTVREAADYLRVHQSTIYRLLHRAQLPAFRIGSDWRFSKPTLDRWIEKQFQAKKTDRS